MTNEEKRQRHAEAMRRWREKPGVKERQNKNINEYKKRKRAEGNPRGFWACVDCRTCKKTDCRHNKAG